MPLMNWDQRMSIGVKRFDEEHQQLVALLNQLYDGMQAGQGKQTLGPVLDGLVKYTKYHFKNEEDFLAEQKWPDLAAHKQLHDTFTKQIIDLQKKYQASSSSLMTMEVMDALKSWLVKHIQGTDKGYGKEMNKKGIN